MLCLWLGAALSIDLLGLLSAGSHEPLLAAAFGASAVLKLRPHQPSDRQAPNLNSAKSWPVS